MFSTPPIKSTQTMCPAGLLMKEFKILIKTYGKNIINPAGHQESLADA
jgi:hypothetical protein